ncbi:mechanosensitive ion channel [Albimonas sp. CAU 1670]|uniref:mechanosensitive ion channel domain-containing protein n=1 Tax=Albimonas sp. CAU 1670 TaxID=3032599 RepID=UPI0023DAE444|nr:mechanosensitive ion channel domain-containing protein [Albimonas sp. CAU 1670]MDF2232271.1 mechanosensitive ion channel [Albimonas sp. CAU 1670]
MRRLAPILLLAMLTLAAAVAPGGPAWGQGLSGAAEAASGGGTGDGSGDGSGEGEVSAADLPTAALLEVLKNADARDRLIQALEQAQADGGQAKEDEGGGDAAASGEAARAGSGGVDAGEPGIGAQIAQTTQAWVNALAGWVTETWTQISQAPERLFDLRGAMEPGVLLAMLEELGLTILGTYAVYVLLRLGARSLRGRIGRKGEDGGPLQKLWMGLLMALLDAATVLAAWAAGYAIAAFLLDPPGSVALRQTLYLNAFVAVEIARNVIRLLLRPETGALRLIPMPDAGARYLSSRLILAAAILGYGQLLVSPLVAQNAGWRAGQAVGVATGLLVVVIGLIATLRHRRAVADWLTPHDAESRKVFAALARLWHVPVLLYLGALFVIVLTRPGNVLWPVLEASGNILLVIVLGMMINGFLAARMREGVHLPETLRAKLPLLEHRLNAFVPKLLLAVRVIVVLAVLGVALEQAGIFDTEGWLSSDLGLRLTGAAVSVALILLGAFLVWLAFSAWVDWRLSHDVGRIPTPRETTLLTLLRNAATIALAVITLMFALSELGIDIAPLIASAGVLGLAIGFGAQKLVQDVITGVFIQLENAMNVGDVVTVGGITGGVEKLTVRSVSIRDLNGTYHLMPFSSVDAVSNFTRDFAYCVMDAGIAYREDIDEAKQGVLDAFAAVKADETQGAALLGDVEWFGVQALGDSAVVLRARAKTKPGSQWGFGRAWNEQIKKIFDERGIEIPFPHQTIYFGELKDGSAPPVHLVRDDEAEVVEGTATPAEESKAAGEEPGAPRTDKVVNRDMPDEDEV